MLYIDQYCYCLCKAYKTKKKPGIYFYNILKFGERGSQIPQQLMDECQTRIQNLIDYSRGNQRLVYQENFKELTVIPLLHRNTSGFVGMHGRGDYLAHVVKKGTFIGFEKTGRLFQWSIFTGKLLFLQQGIRVKENIDWKQFKIYEGDQNDLTYHMGYSDNFLIVSKKPIDEVKD